MGILHAWWFADPCAPLCQDLERYWFNEDTGEVFCLAEAPNKEAAVAVHREAHGLMADEISEVKEGSSLHRKGPGLLAALGPSS